MKSSSETMEEEATRADGAVLLLSTGESVDLHLVWSESTCNDDPCALGLYLPAERRIILNLRNVYRDAVRMVPGPEGPMIGTFIHLHDMCLIHELVHWCTGTDEKHDNWNSLILGGLIIPICEELHLPNAPP